MTQICHFLWRKHARLLQKHIFSLGYVSSRSWWGGLQVDTRRNDLKSLLLNRNPGQKNKQKKSHGLVMPGLGQTACSCCRELQAAMGENEGTRITAIISAGPRIQGGCRSVRPKQSRVPQITPPQKKTHTHFTLVMRQLPRHPYTDVHSISTHAQRRIRRLSSVTNVRRLHREAHGGICCADGDVCFCTKMAGSFIV